MANTCSFNTDTAAASSAVSSLGARGRPHARRRPGQALRGGVLRPSPEAMRPKAHVEGHERSSRVQCARVQPGGCVSRSSPAAVAAARRRGLLLAAVAAALVVALAVPWGGAGGRPLATPGPAPVGDPVSPHALYIVQPGDTLWTIAQRLDPGGDPRTIVAQLAAEVGGDTIVPGERLVLP